MALVKSGIVPGSSPSLYYELHATQLSGSGTTRQVKLELGLKINGGSGSTYGFSLDWLPKIHYSNGGWQKVKGTETWKGGQANPYWYNWTANVDVGTTGSTSIGVGFETKSKDKPDTSWKTSQSASFSVGATNEKPVISGTTSTSPSGTISENATSITVTSPVATDVNGNLSGYRCQVSINGGGYADVYSGSSRSFNHNVGGYGSGTTFRYRFDAYDSAGAYSVDWAYSNTVTKNTLTGATLAGGANIGFDTKDITFSWSGASNTNGASNTYRLSCDGITIYNGASISGTSLTLPISKVAPWPTGQYLWFDQIRDKLAGNAYQGNLTFTLTTSNPYGSSKTSSKTIWCDLRTNPNPATGQQISTTTSESTIYKKVAFANNYYFLPDGSGVARVKWSAGSGGLGEGISYEVFVAYGSSSWQKVADVPGNTLYYNHKIGKQSSSQKFKYLVRTKTSYGSYSDSITPEQTLHYYNAPSITVGQIKRQEKDAEIPITVKTATSIPGVLTSGSWSGHSQGANLGTTQSEQIIKLLNLEGNKTYSISVIYNDNTGFSSNQTKSISISQNLPVVFVNQYGLGVGGSKANASNVLNINGNVNIDGVLAPAILNIPSRDTRNENNKPEVECPKPGVKFDFRSNGSAGLSDGGLYTGVMSFRPYGSGTDWSGGPAYQLAFSENGNLWLRKGNTAWEGWKAIYHTGKKPSASDVGALSINGGTIGGTISRTGTSQSWLNGAKGDGCLLNMTSQSGYSPIIRQKTSSGAWTWGAYTNDTYHLTYMTDSNINAGNNSPTTQYNFPTNGGGTVAVVEDFPSSVNGVGGWIKLPGRIVIQWGYITGITSGWHTINLPIAYPNANYNITFGQYWHGNNSWSYLTCGNQTGAKFDLSSNPNNSAVFWHTIGMY